MKTIRHKEINERRVTRAPWGSGLLTVLLGGPKKNPWTVVRRSRRGRGARNLIPGMVGRQ